MFLMFINWCLEEIKINKSGIDLWEKGSSSEKIAADSG